MSIVEDQLDQETRQHILLKLICEMDQDNKIGILNSIVIINSRKDLLNLLITLHTITRKSLFLDNRLIIIIFAKITNKGVAFSLDLKVILTTRIKLDQILSTIKIIALIRNLRNKLL